jgi:hypothetical protein
MQLLQEVALIIAAAVQTALSNGQHLQQGRRGSAQADTGGERELGDRSGSGLQTVSATG